MLTGCSGGEWRRPNSSQLPILTVHNNNRISLVLPKRTKTGKLDPSDNFGGSCKKNIDILLFPEHILKYFKGLKRSLIFGFSTPISCCDNLKKVQY